jgi:hypothetical protein
MSGRFAIAASACVTALSVVSLAQTPGPRALPPGAIGMWPDPDGLELRLLEKGTRIGLQQIVDGRRPSIGHFAIKAAPFDRGALTARLRESFAEVLESSDEPDVVRFRDNNGIVVEVKARD